MTPLLNQLLKKYGGLALLLALYGVLVMAYSYAIPFSKGPDEYINYQYILFVAKHHHLPKTVSEREEAGVKADWQPLYHLVSGLIATPISLTESPDLKVTWEPPTRQLIDIVLPRATLIRTEDERPPYRGVYAIWQTGRWVSMILGAGTLAATYLLCLTIWPNRAALAIGATALLGFMPRFLFTHAVLSDDTMLGFWLTLYLLLLAQLIQRVNNGRHQPIQYSGLNLKYLMQTHHAWILPGLGVTAGLAIVTKYTAIPAILTPVIVGGILAHRQKWSGMQITSKAALTFLGLLVACGWWIGWIWWYFNQIEKLGFVMGLIRPLLPGAVVDDNPTTSRLTAFLSGQSVDALGQAPGAGGSYLDWVRHTFETFWGVTVFGAEPDWSYPYAIILLLLTLFCVVAVVGLWRGFRQITQSRKLLWGALILHILVFFPLPLLRFTLSRRLNDAAQGRHLLFPAGAPIVILLMAGWLIWFRPQWRNRAALLTGGAMLLWAVIHLAYLWMAYPPPLPVRTTPGPQMQIAYPIQVDFGDIVQLSGYQIRLSDDESTLQVDLLWQSLDQAWEDYRTEITLVDSQNRPQLQWVSHPANGRFPTRAWQPGDWVRDTLHIPVTGLAAGEYQVQLRLLGWEEPLESTQGERVSLTSINLTDVPQNTEQQGRVNENGTFLSKPAAYRYRSTIPITLPEAADIVLVGPDQRPRRPATNIGSLRTFLVDYNWPSGEYAVQVEGSTSNLKVQVENFDAARNGWSFTPPEMMHPAEANFAGKIELLGYDLPLRRVEAGGGIPLVLYWQGLTQMRQDYTISVQLLDSDLQRRGGYDRFTRETYNTYLWVPDEVIDDGFAVPIDDDAPNGIYTIRIGWYQEKDGQAIPLPLTQNGQPIDETSVVIGPIKVGGPPPHIVTDTVEPNYPLNVTLGDTITLQGYDLKQNAQDLTLNLYWQSVAQTETDYTVFVHLRDETGQVVAQADGPPVKGQYPTSLWDVGEIIPDEIIVPLPPELETGRYELAVGLYNPTTDIRLAVPGTPDDSFILTQIELD